MAVQGNCCCQASAALPFDRGGSEESQNKNCSLKKEAVVTEVAARETGGVTARNTVTGEHSNRGPNVGD
jgi:hypothetical protein